MTSYRYMLSSLIIALILLLTGCEQKQDNSSVGNQAVVDSDVSQFENISVKTNAEELGVLIKLPYDVMDVAWQDDRPNGRLIAVMRFSAADIEKIISRSASVTHESAVTIQVEPWFPQELVAQGEMSGDGTLKGKMYAADMFLQPPYSVGRLVRIDEADYIYLEVSMK